MYSRLCGLCLCLMIMTSSPINADEPTLTASISEEQILQLLPPDADRHNLKKQERAIKRGFYWTRTGVIRPLDKEIDTPS